LDRTRWDVWKRGKEAKSEIEMGSFHEAVRRAKLP